MTSHSVNTQQYFTLVKTYFYCYTFVEIVTL